MAYDFDGGAELTLSSVPVGGTYPFSMSCWFQVPVSGYYNNTLLGLVAGSDWLGIKVANPNTRIYSWENAVSAPFDTPPDTYTANVWCHITGVWASNASRVGYVDGGTGTAETTTANPDAPTAAYIGGRGTDQHTDLLCEVAMWDAALTEEEAKMMALGYSPLLVRPGNLKYYAPLRNDTRDIIGGVTTSGSAVTIADHPKIIMPSAQILQFPSAGAPPAAVTADAGAYAITGSAAGLGVGRAVTADAGAVAVTGSASGLGQGYAITAYTGGSIITVADAGLTLGYSFAADAGAFAVTGSAAGLGVNHTISAGAGSVAVTGSAATLTTAGAFSLTADAGAVAITGAAATLTKTAAYSLASDAGAVSITGSAAGLDVNYTITIDAGSVSVTGSAAGLGQGYAVASDAGAVAVTGSAATLTTAGAFSLTADAGAVAITGAAATLTKTTAYSLAVDAGAVAVTGSAAGLGQGYTIAADIGSYTITGADGSLEFYRKLQAGEGVFAITGADADLLSSLVPDIVAIIAGDQIINRYLAEPQTVNRTLSEAQNLT